MDIKITEQFDNKLLHRKEVKGWVSFAGPTPSNADVQLQIATQLSTDKNLVVIDHIYNTYGAQEAKIFAKAYEKKDFLEKYEPKKKEKKAKEGEGGEAPAEGKKEDKKEGAKPEGKQAEKKEEKKEDKPAAEKKEAKPADKPPEEKKDDKPPEGAKE